MIVRVASFRDLGAVEQLYREATAEQESTALSGADSPVPRRTLLRLWHGVNMTLSAMMPLHDPGATLYVAEDGESGLVGFAQVQSPAGHRNAWQIVNLCVASNPRGHFAREQLIDFLCNDGLSHGVRRFHVRVPLDHPLLPVFVDHGFQQYATEQILYRDEPSRVERDGTALLRPARRDDLAGIHLLYLRTTPSHVADIEGASFKVWQASYMQGWMTRLGRDDVTHYVVERPGVVAWVGLRHAQGSQPTVLALMCEGTNAELRGRVIDQTLSLVQPGPVSCVLRHYDSELIRELQQRGFDIFGAQLLLVRELGLKVRLRAVSRQKKPVLVHAGVVQSAPNGPLLHVIHSKERRRT